MVVGRCTGDADPVDVSGIVAGGPGAATGTSDAGTDAPWDDSDTTLESTGTGGELPATTCGGTESEADPGTTTDEASSCSAPGIFGGSMK